MTNTEMMFDTAFMSLPSDIIFFYKKIKNHVDAQFFLSACMLFLQVSYMLLLAKCLQHDLQI